MEGMPGFSLSAGPSSADTSANSGVGGTHTGGFYFKQKKQGWQQYVPLALAVGALWLILKKK